MQLKPPKEQQQGTSIYVIFKQLGKLLFIRYKLSEFYQRFKDFITFKDFYSKALFLNLKLTFLIT